MIELVSESRCITCDKCIRVCPTNVFDRGPSGVPVIKRQSDCQTCFMCEAWCPTDALFVAPETGPADPGSNYHDEGWLLEQGLLGSYRRELGWAEREPLAGPRRSVNLMTREPLPLGGVAEGGST
jgi:NAD-dependent dihydropyrimidine dehydrogenase PreA subunit